MKKKHIKLSKKERKRLEELIANSSIELKVYKRVKALLELDNGSTYRIAHEHSNLSERGVKELVKRYRKCGLDCLYDLKRPGRPIVIEKKIADKICLMACEEAPKGYSQWSLRLLANMVVELGYCEEISHVTVRTILKKRNLSLT